MTEFDKWTIKKAKYAYEFCKIKNCCCKDAVSYKDENCNECFEKKVGTYNAK